MQQPFQLKIYPMAMQSVQILPRRLYSLDFMCVTSLSMCNQQLQSMDHNYPETCDQKLVLGKYEHKNKIEKKYGKKINPVTQKL